MKTSKYSTETITKLFCQLNSNKQGPHNDLSTQLEALINSLKEHLSDNLQIFKLALSIKHNLIQNEIGTYYNLNMNFYQTLYNSYMENIDESKEYIEIIQLFILMHRPPNEYLTMLLKNSLNEDQNNGILLKNLQLIHSIYELNVDFTETLPRFKQVIEKTILSSNKKIFILVSYQLLPQYIKLNNSSNILETIGKRLETTKSYLHLCCLSDYLIIKPDENNYSIIQKLWFWECIEHGLNDQTDSIHRKSSLFLLKRSINEVINHQFTIELTPNNYLIKFDSNKNYHKIWETFIFLYESLDEKQSHIITPGLGLLDTLAELNPIWQAIIYRRLLSHESGIIQRYGIERILKSEFLNIHEKQFLLTILHDLTLTLNDMYLFQSGLDKINLNEFLVKLNNSKLLEYFLMSCVKIQWQTVPFFYLCYGLFEIGHLNDDGINENIIENFINISETILNIYIRTASQCLLLHYLQNSNRITVKILNQIDFLLNKCSIRMNSRLWTNLVKWIEKQNVQNIKPIDSPKIVLLLRDANVITDEELMYFIRLKLNEFTNMSTRYKIDENLNESLVFISNLYEEISYSNNVELEKHSLKLILKSRTCLISYMNRIVTTSDDVDMATINNFLQICKLLFKDFTDFQFIKKCEEILMNVSSNIEKYFSLSLLKIVIENTSSLECICEVYKIITTLPTLKKENFSKNKDKKLISGYFKTLNSLEIICIKYTKNFDEKSLNRIISHIFESLEIGGRESVSVTMELIQCTLPNILFANVCDIQRLMNICWNEMLELKKCDLFWDAMLHFIRAFFKVELLLHTKYHEELFKYGYLILEQAQQTRGLAKLLYDRLLVVTIENKENYVLIETLIPFIIKGLTFGSNLRKDERIEFETTEVIKKLEHVHVSIAVENKYILDLLVRVRSIEMVSQIITTSKYKKNFLETFLDALINEYELNNRTRYYANSTVHRIKNRLLQSMIFVQPHLFRAQNLKLYQHVCKVLLIESPQPSIRYQIEWLLILIVNEDPTLINDLYSRVHEFTIGRISSLISIISVTYHLTILDPTKFLTYANSIILPLSMLSNFNVRLYAQATYLWLLDKFDTQNKYETIYTSLQQTLNPPNTVCKPYLRLKDDFFLTNFHPTQHLTIETIYNDFPRLTLLIDEALDLKYFEKSLFKSFQNSSDALKICTIPWSNKDISTTITQETDVQSIYQKKSIPLKALIPELDMDSNKFKRKSGNLIVVASLVERAPNLGGLSRTCEIFGVEQFVINNLRQMESKDFQNLSVSSEKWLDIIEISVNQLRGYLLEMKKNGYTIVGCEQSTDSVQLIEFEFPRQTVLLLGNEKEGIHPNLLGLVDVCVEIPQCGVIRSLNVHVSGAITIWQYACQHLFKKNT